MLLSSGKITKKRSIIISSSHNQRKKIIINMIRVINYIDITYSNTRKTNQENPSYKAKFNYQFMGSCEILVSNSRSFQGLSKDKSKYFQGALNTKHESRRKPKIPKTRHFLAFHESTCTDLLKTIGGYLLYLFFSFLIAVNEANSKHLQISRSLINFQRKFSFSRSFKCL